MGYLEAVEAKDGGEEGSRRRENGREAGERSSSSCLSRWRSKGGVVVAREQKREECGAGGRVDERCERSGRG